MDTVTLYDAQGNLVWAGKDVRDKKALATVNLPDKQKTSSKERYDVTTDGKTQKALPKRKVILTAVRQLIVVRQRATPKEIYEVAGKCLFAVVDRTINGSAFRAELQKRKPDDPRAEKRYFTRDDELFHDGGKTYALTNQWGSRKFKPVLDALAETYGDFGFTYRESE